MAIDSLDKLQPAAPEISALVKSARAVLKYGDFKKSARVIYDLCKDLIGATAGYVALLNEDGAGNEVVFLDPGDAICTVDPSLEVRPKTPEVGQNWRTRPKAPDARLTKPEVRERMCDYVTEPRARKTQQTGFSAAFLAMPVRGLRARAYETGKPARENDFSNSQWKEYLPEGHAPLDNALFIPIINEGKAVGLLGLANKAGGFTDRDAEIGAAFGGLVAIALSNQRTLDSLQRSEERFRALVQNATDAIVCSDESGNISLWNRAAEKMFGYSSKEIVGGTITLIMPERFRAGHESGMKRLAQTGKPKVIGRAVELAGVRRDGAEFPLELSLSSWEAEGKIFFAAIIHDITKRKNVEAALEVERQRLAATLASTEEAKALSDALALENARLYEAEHTVAETLQQSFLEMPESIPGLDFGYVYRSATETARVGGDFYDLFELEHDRVGILIGEVAGKGLEAAALTSLIKSTVKAYAFENYFPASILAKTNDLVGRAVTSTSAFVTLFFGLLDRRTGHLAYSGGGHPPVMIQRPDGSIKWLTTVSPVVGVFSNITFVDASVIIEPGERLILYTDGVTEARSGKSFFGDEGLVTAVTDHRSAAVNELPQLIFKKIIEYTGGTLADDVAILAVGFDREQR